MRPVEATGQSGTTPAATAPTATSQQAPAEVTQLPEDPVASVLGSNSDIAAQITKLREELQQRAESLAADAATDDPAREALNKVIQQAITELQKTEELLGKGNEWKARATSAPSRIEQLKQQKELSSTELSYGEKAVLAAMDFEEGQARLRELTAELEAVRTRKNNLNNEIALRANRRKELPQLISEAKKKLQDINESRVADDAAADPVMVEALRKANNASRLLATQTLWTLEQELRAYDAEAPLLPLQLEVARQAENLLQQQVEVLNSALAKQRASRIAGFRDKLKELSLPESESFDEIRFWLAMDPAAAPPNGSAPNGITWFELAKKQDAVTSEIRGVQEELDRWKARQALVKGRIEPDSRIESAPGSNQWVVARLRKQRDELPNTNLLAARLQQYESEMRLAESLQYDLSDTIDELRGRQASIASNTFAEADRKPLEVCLETLTAMKADADDYLNDLYLLADTKTQLISMADDYRSFIDKQLLWTPSVSRLQIADFGEAVTAGRWLLDAANWRTVGRVLLQDFFKNPAWYVVFLLAFGSLLFNQGKLRKNLAENAKLARRNTCTDFGLSLRATAMTFLIAAPVPLVLVFLAWRLNVACESSLETGFPRSLAVACLWTTSTFVSMELLRQVCRSSGLGISHFGWPSEPTLMLKRNLRWLIDFTIPLVVLVLLLDYQLDSQFEDSLGRLAFIALMVLFSVFFSRVLAPSNGIFSGFLEAHRGGWIDQLKFLWYPCIILLPLALATLSITGYFYTALHLTAKFDSTACAAIFLLLAFCLTERWLLLNRRKLMMAQARQRLEAAAKKSAEGELPLQPASESQLNLVDLNTQTKRLVTSGFVAMGLVILFLVWSDVIPAVQLLERFVLWQVPGDLPDETISITLANLVAVIPILVLTAIVTRNAPGLLEIALLQHLPLTSAARYAVTTLARYILVGLGIVLVSSTIGLRWANYQWLVAGLGVGLGFGLQEIFANFISGIILLFEQPIRVGDIVTIDGTTGTVAKIRMRATTITNWDRQELIVPNKQLITGTLINWTLSDSTNRILLNVGVAYGSDTERACEIIHQICSEHPEVLRDPAPLVTFEGFGDNTLNLVVRAYLSSLENRLATIHQLHGKIYRALREAEIEIAFPQRDLHLRSLPEPFSRWLNSQTLGDGSSSKTDNAGRSNGSHAMSAQSSAKH